MARVPVFYATTHGQTRRIAEYIAAELQAAGVSSLALEVTSSPARHYDWRHVDGVVLAASLHAGAHQAAAAAFARDHLAALTPLPSWFVSVSLSAASKHADGRQAAERLAHEFTEDAGWSAGRVSCVAGRLAYTRYSWPTRWMMRRIARKEGGPTDTSCDHELTDWPALGELARSFARDVRRRPACRHAAPVNAR